MPTLDPLKGITITAKGSNAEILVYEEIGSNFFTGAGLTAKAFDEKLKALGKISNINVRINSPGGSVFDAAAIYNTLKNHGAKVTTVIDGAALSAASVIAMAGSEIKMAKNAFMMIHNPSTYAKGDSAEMKKTADMLDAVKASLVATYADRTNQPADAISQMMDSETWMTAAEAKAKGFVDTVTDTPTVAASFDLSMFNVPEKIKPLPKLGDPYPAGYEIKRVDDHNHEITVTYSTKEPIQMAEELKPVAATITEIENACEGATPEFVLSQIKAAATMTQALTAWNKEQSKQLAAVMAEAKAAKDAADKATADAVAAALAAAAKPGVKAIASEAINGDGTAAQTATEKWNDKLDELKKTMPANKAAIVMARKYPELRKAIVAEANA